MKRVTLFIVVGLAALGLLTGCSDNDDSYEKVEAARMEPIGDSGLNKVILTEKAAERVDIQMAAVEASSGNGGRKMGGTVVSPADMNGSATGGYYVAVSLTENERAAVDSSAAALVWSTDAPDGQAGLTAMPSAEPPDGLLSDPEPSSTDVVVYYEIDGGISAMAPGARVFVEVPLAGSGAPRTVVPYSSVVYDLDGRTWVYVSPEPLVFQREEVEVERIEGDFAILSSGPAVGTEVVMTGATELLGVESGVGGGH